MLHENGMTAGILIVAHGDQGRALIDCATHVYGTPPERLAAVSAGQDEPRDAMLSRLHDELARLDDGAGVLVLTDLFGATPCNLVRELLVPGKVAALSGVNLPMVLRAVRFRDQPLATLVERVQAAAVECTVSVPAAEPAADQP
ncbi:sugar transport PTS system IIA component [Oryzomicrobium terrae]|uniref:Sugar transport PTS system IIA component n=2 Tax=Oryzomicrobium terrae TaxID=1735038 RepID=A0A5C1E493_9RHOO|nr:sugar transport PTS system IIA component [Oryzomicrobium terrae]